MRSQRELRVLQIPPESAPASRCMQVPLVLRGPVLVGSEPRSFRVAYGAAILSSDDVRQQAVLAGQSGAPPHLVNALEAGQAALFLNGLSPEDYFGDEDFPWAELIHPASKLAEDWTVAIWKDAPGDIDFDPATASYDAYRRSL